MLYNTIKELREHAGYSQAELARRLNVTRSSVNAWEMGISVPTTVYILEMAQLFRVTTDYILGASQEYTISLDGLDHDEINAIYNLIECFKKNKNK